MVNISEIERLSALARIALSDEEKTRIAGEMSDIVDFVSQVQELSVTEISIPAHKNQMREDGVPHAQGEYTEDLLANAPTRKGQSLSVPKIISND